MCVELSLSLTLPISRERLGDLSTSIATVGFCDGESIRSPMEAGISSHMKGTLTRANAILQKGLRHN